MAHHRQAQTLKEELGATVEGINFGRVLAFHMYDVSSFTSVRRIVWALMRRTAYRSESGDAPGLLFFSFGNKGRRDYEYMISTVENLADGDYQRVDVSEAWSLLQWTRTLRQIRHSKRVVAHVQGPFLFRKSLLLAAAWYLDELRKLEQIVQKRKRVLTFCDAAPLDNLVAQLAKRNGIPTITLQHGQYRVLDDSNMSPDAEAYSNFVSDTILAWGPATVAEFARAGIDEQRLAVVGWIRQWPEARPPSEPMKKFGVMLNGSNGAESNVALLAAASFIAENLDLTYIVRLHPSFGVDKYVNHVTARCDGIRAMGVEEYVGAVDFSLGHMSGAVIEMLRYGSPVYVLDDGSLAPLFQFDGLTFDSVEKLLERVSESPAEERERAMILHMWFNHDANQRELIREHVRIPEVSDAAS